MTVKSGNSDYETFKPLASGPCNRANSLSASSFFIPRRVSKARHHTIPTPGQRPNLIPAQRNALGSNPPHPGGLKARFIKNTSPLPCRLPHSQNPFIGPSTAIVYGMLGFDYESVYPHPAPLGSRPEDLGYLFPPKLVMSSHFSMDFGPRVSEIVRLKGIGFDVVECPFAGFSHAVVFHIR